MAHAEIPVAPEESLIQVSTWDRLSHMTTRGRLVMVSSALGEFLWWAHRFRRLLILSPGLAMAVAITALIVRNWRHLLHLFH